MADFWRYVRHSIRILFRNDFWFLLIPLLFLGVVGSWTLYVVEKPENWSPMLSVIQSEALGSLLSVFLFAGLLDAETRHGANEIIFSKPHRPAILLGVRLALAMLLLVVMMLGLLTIYHFRFGDAEIVPALLIGFPSWLFTGMIALTVSQFTRTSLTGIAVSLGYWLWNSSLGIMYNPLLVLTAGAVTATGGESVIGGNLWLNKVVLLLMSALLFWLNTRRLSRFGGESHAASRNPNLLGRFATPAKVAAILLVYFWTGALAKFWMIDFQSAGFPSSRPGLEQRAFKGSTLIGSNSMFQMLMSVYGPVPIGSFLGPGASAFLRGLGIGLDTNSDTFAEDRRAALEAAARVPGFWRNRARLELAATLASPVAFSGNYMVGPPENESMWLTLGFADSNRWWIGRQAAGENVARAKELCGQARASSPSPTVSAEALQLQAALDEIQWDFPASEGKWRELAYEYPSTGIGAESANSLSGSLMREGRFTDAIALQRHVLLHQPMPQRAMMALQLANEQQQAGDIAGERETLIQGIADWNHRPRWKQSPQLGSDDPGDQLQKNLASLDTDSEKGATAPPMAVPPSGPSSNGPGFSAHTRVLVGNQPLPDVAVALVPIPAIRNSMPESLRKDWDQAMPAGHRLPPPPRPDPRDPTERQSPDVWRPNNVAYTLQQNPNLIARSDAKGEVHWASVPAGAYALVVHLGTWQVRDGQNLAPTPIDGPIQISAPDTALPDVRFVAPIRFNSSQNEDGVPHLTWDAVPGATKYRVALRLRSDNQLGPDSALGPGEGSFALDPGVIWWRDDVTQTAVDADPNHFVGPPSPEIHGGVYPIKPYLWSIDALDPSGKVLATTETLIPQKVTFSKSWTALRQPDTQPDKKNEHTSQPPHMIEDVAWNPAMGQPQSANFDSPFLETIIQRGKHSDWTKAVIQNSVPRKPKSQKPEPVDLRQGTHPSLVSNGIGLPPRPPLQMPQMASPAGPGMPPGNPGGPGMSQNIPPQLLAQLQAQGRMPPGSPGASPNGLPPGGMPAGGLPPGAMPPGAMPSGAIPPGVMPPGKMPPGMPPTGNAPPIPPPGSRMPSPVSGRTPPSGIPPSHRPMMPPAKRVDQPGENGKPNSVPSVLTRVQLVTFDEGSGIHWTGGPEKTPGPLEPGDAGLSLPMEAYLSPGAPLPLPAHTRRLLLRSAEGKVEGELTLADKEGKTRSVSLTTGGKNDAVAVLPDGEWSLTRLHLTPLGRPAVLSSLDAEIPSAPGIYAVATDEEGTVALEIRNLGPAAERLSIFINGSHSKQPDATVELAPGSHTVLRYPDTLLSQDAFIRWSGGASPILRR